MNKTGKCKTCGDEYYVRYNSSYCSPECRIKGWENNYKKNNLSQVKGKDNLQLNF